MGLHSGSALTTPRSDLGLAFKEMDLESNEMGFIGFQVAPVMEVEEQKDQYRVIDLKTSLQPRDTRRTQDGGYNDVSGSFSMEDYKTEDHGLEFHVDYRRAESNRRLVDEEAEGAELVRYGVMEAHELRVIAAIDALTPVAAANPFSTNSADIPKDFTAYCQTLRNQCGVRPNAMVVDTEVVDHLLDNDGVQALFEGMPNIPKLDGRNRSAVLGALANALKLEEVIEANAVKNTQTAPLAESLSAMWPVNKALLFVKSKGSTTRRQFMRTIHWSADGSQIGGTFEEYEVPGRRGKMLRCRMDTQEKVIYQKCAMVLSGVKP